MKGKRQALVVTMALVIGMALPLRGELVLQTGFDTPAERDAWSKAGFATWTTGDGGTTSLRITAPREQAQRSHMISRPLDLTPCGNLGVRPGQRTRAERAVTGGRGRLPWRPGQGGEGHSCH